MEYMRRRSSRLQKKEKVNYRETTDKEDDRIQKEENEGLKLVISGKTKLKNQQNCIYIVKLINKNSKCLKRNIIKVGHTTKTLEKRLKKHNYDYQGKYIFEIIGVYTYLTREDEEDLHIKLRKNFDLSHIKKVHDRKTSEIYEIEYLEDFLYFIEDNI